MVKNQYPAKIIKREGDSVVMRMKGAPKHLKELYISDRQKTFKKGDNGCAKWKTTSSSGRWEFNKGKCRK